MTKEHDMQASNGKIRPEDARVVLRAKWLLRLIGGAICFSCLAVLTPLAWLQDIHEWLGLGEPPHQPVFEYLARTLSAMYFAHGVMVLAVSTDVHRYQPLVRIIGLLNLMLGIAFLVVGCVAGMPGWWICIEGPPIFLVGLVVLAVHGRLSKLQSA